MWILVGVSGAIVACGIVAWLICRVLESGATDFDAPERWEVFRAGLSCRAPYEWTLRKGYFIHRCYEHG